MLSPRSSQPASNSDIYHVIRLVTTPQHIFVELEGLDQGLPVSGQPACLPAWLAARIAPAADGLLAVLVAGLKIARQRGAGPL